MAKTTDKQGEPATDVMPEIDDDVIDVAEDRAEPVAEAVAPVTDDRTEAQAKPYNARDEAVRRYRELRDQAEAKGREDADTADDEVMDEAVDEPAAAPAAEKVASADDADDGEPEFEIKVNGKSKKLSASELIAKAQIALASEEILSEAKAIREEARALRGRNPAEQHQPAEDDDLNGQDAQPDARAAKADQPAPTLDADRLEEIIQGIQVGDVEEGKKALAEFAALVASSAAARTQDVRPVIAEALAERQLQDEINRAGNTFRDKYGSIAQNQEMLALSLSRLSNELRDDLSRTGADPETTKSLDIDALVTRHMQARSRGAKGLRSYDAMMDKVGADMMSTYGSILGSPEPAPAKPAPTAPSQATERLERKRAASPQPRTAGVRAEPHQPAKPKSRAEVIAEMRRSRGFTG